MDILPETVSQSIYVPYAATNYKTSATTQNQANYPDGDILAQSAKPYPTYNIANTTTTQAIPTTTTQTYSTNIEAYPATTTTYQTTAQAIPTTTAYQTTVQAIPTTTTQTYSTSIEAYPATSNNYYPNLFDKY